MKSTSISNGPPGGRYTLVAIVLHWVLGLSIIAAFGVGLYMEDLERSPEKFQLIGLHKAAGVTILALSALRLLWRLTHRPPPLPLHVLSAMPAWQRVAHHGVHHVLYILFFAVPLSGWAMSSAAGYPVSWFGLLTLPSLVNENKELAHGLSEVHEVLAFVLAGFVAVHIAAAIKHHWIDKDRLIHRILP